MPPQYASNTKVSVEKSRQEINTLLKQWGASGFRWTDDMENDQVTLEFVWRPDEDAPVFQARFTLALPSSEELAKEARHKRTGQFLEDKYYRLLDGHGRQEHRALALFLKAVFVGVEEGIISPEQVFLPFLVDKHGRTVSDYALGNLELLHTEGVAGLLPARKE
jgi:hypothetical protein